MTNMLKTFAVFLLVLAPVQAGLIFSLDNPIQSAIPGDSVVFVGLLFNDDILDVFLNGASATLPYAELSVDYTDFFTLVPLALSAGESYSGPIFSVDVTNSAVPGDYFGSFGIQGGLDETATDDLATENFQISIHSANVPEPPSAVLVGVSALVLGLLLPWRTKSSFRVEPSRLKTT